MTSVSRSYLHSMRPNRQKSGSFPKHWNLSLIHISKFNLIDVPGLFDFETGAAEGITAAESVLICVSGRSEMCIRDRRSPLQHPVLSALLA